MLKGSSPAPGGPGIPARWTSSAKSGVGTALSASSRVWFTLSHGIFNEIYYPRLDLACTRDLGLLVSDGQDFFSEEKRDTQSQVSYLAKGVPAYRLVNNCKQGRYQIEKEILSDPQRDVVLQYTHFIPQKGSLKQYHLYVLLAPHVANRGAGNTAWIGDYKGTPMMFAQREDTSLALACSSPKDTYKSLWLKASAGFVGSSDGWQDVSQHKQMTWLYERAENGNVALIGEIDLEAAQGEFVLALGFGRNPYEAGQRALASLIDGFEAAKTDYVQQWQAWQATLLPIKEPGKQKADADLYPVSAALLRIHEAKRFPGGLIASLSVPWGFAKGDDDLGGYHLAWPRDLVESAAGLLAAGAEIDVQRVLHYLQVTQESDGHWPQNMWLDGNPYWGGIQMDETALPILLLDLARRQGALAADDMARLWPMVRRAAGFLARNGPVTQQDRWEEDPGYSPFTLAAEIAALLCAADLAELNHEPEVAAYLRQTADNWNENVERWIYVTGTDLAKQVGVEGYYVRVAPPEVAEAASPAQGFVPIKNRPPGQSMAAAQLLVSPDALALVRFGLRAPNDPRILNTVKVIDALLKVETPNGPTWHRYNGDGYGEHQDGEPFDGTGIGRGWPLLSGERAHYELAAGNRTQAIRLLHAMEAFANKGGMLSEQIWDSEDIPEKELFCGRPSGSAMPLLWAHAEYVKLRRSLQDGKPFDTPPQTIQRYVNTQTPSPYVVWCFNHKVQSIPAGKQLRIETLSPAVIYWSINNRKRVSHRPTREALLGLHYLDLPTEKLPSGSSLTFNFYWPDEDRWESGQYSLQVVTNNSVQAP